MLSGIPVLSEIVWKHSPEAGGVPDEAREAATTSDGAGFGPRDRVEEKQQQLIYISEAQLTNRHNICYINSFAYFGHGQVDTVIFGWWQVPLQMHCWCYVKGTGGSIFCSYVLG